jgi:hypothetical protein
MSPVVMGIGTPELGWLVLVAVIVALARSMRWWLRRSSAPTPHRSSFPKGRPKFRTILYQEERRVDVATEVVGVPKGVSITVKRARSVQHEVKIDCRASGSLRLEASLLKAASASVLADIEQAHGRSYQQTVETAYEVALSGEKASRYRLVWTEVWLTGTVAVGDVRTASSLPFTFRQRAELEVTALDSRGNE